MWGEAYNGITSSTIVLIDFLIQIIIFEKYLYKNKFARSQEMAPRFKIYEKSMVDPGN